jgi:hypothetical protein
MTMSDPENYRTLVSEAREKAANASYPATAEAHDQMADLYDKLAGNPENYEAC